MQVKCFEVRSQPMNNHLYVEGLLNEWLALHPHAVVKHLNVTTSYLEQHAHDVNQKLLITLLFEETSDKPNT